MNHSYNSSYDSIEQNKLSYLHRRVYPLNLAPLSTSTTNKSFIRLPCLSTSAAQTPTKSFKINRKLIQPVQSEVLEKKEQKVPKLNYKNIKTLGNRKNTSNGYQNLSQNFDYFPEKRKKALNICKIFGKNKIFPCYEKNHKKKKHLSDYKDEIKTVKKVKRISSSEITYPALSLGQIIDRIKLLVLDPLKDEVDD